MFTVLSGKFELNLHGSKRVMQALLFHTSINQLNSNLVMSLTSFCPNPSQVEFLAVGFSSSKMPQNALDQILYEIKGRAFSLTNLIRRKKIRQWSFGVQSG